MTDKDDKAGNETAKPCEPVQRITNDEKVEVNETVNKKLTAMSKEAKARKKKKLQKPPKDKDEPTTSTSSVSSMTNNQIVLKLGVVGVIIAGVSLYYQRKTVMKMFKKDQKKVEEPEVHLPHDVKDEPVDTALIKW